VATSARLVSDLGRIAREAEAKAALIVDKTAHDIEAGAKAVAPVDTGHLRASIKAESHGPLEAEVRVGAEYGIYVEQGTRHMAPQPYLHPAAEAAREGFEQATRQVFE
jgi:HK97 gp10 family phage protein